ncbi:YopT-type cysteine protease domain-containing protein [Parashewanella tropica]|uniref:YopT-type cysteine protease domain-containing protein n=1 Tax=Parashewanella tropica TaxID=2547970 RepID=UPI00105A7C02|nr:YopT-type cysteine protease domain-containing protein [Parashewanella tropica]
MSVIFEKIAHMIAASASKDIQLSAKKYGGHCTHPFCQGKGNIFKAIKGQKDTHGGVCHALSSIWIYYHIKGDSLWNHLYINYNPNILNQVVMDRVKMLQKFGIAASGDGMDQDRVTEDWFKSKGIAQKHFSLVGSEGYTRGKNKKRFFSGIHGRQIDKSENSAKKTDPKTLAKAIARPYSGISDYKLVSVFGTLAAHTFAVYTGTNEILMFDPNFGEYWFSTSFFENWFANYFWHKAKYDVSFALGKAWEIRHYSPLC